MNQLEASRLSVGYHNCAVLKQIDFHAMHGKMTCILGPNGSGKTTLLKTLANLLPKIEGSLKVSGENISGYRSIDLAKELSVVLTDKISLENMTCYDVAAMGRYPYTGFFGVLSEQDHFFVMECLKKCSADYLKDQYFHRISEGEKQKILLARGLAQNTNLLILDEPTSHLDIRYKLEILAALKSLCIHDGKTVICTLHEPELALKCCDYFFLVRDGAILEHGTVEEVILKNQFDHLYGLQKQQFHPLLGIAEFPMNDKKDIFLIGSDSHTPLLMRQLVGCGYGFGIGILREHDISRHIADCMGATVISQKEYEEAGDGLIELAYQSATQFSQISVADFPECLATIQNTRLVNRLKQEGRSVFKCNELPNLFKALDFDIISKS